MPSDLSRPRANTEARLMEIVFPDHCNHLGTLFGGQALVWMDKAAFLAASRYAGCTVVTARSDRIDFVAPVRLGEIVEAVAKVRSVGRSSMTVLAVARSKAGRRTERSDERRVRHDRGRRGGKTACGRGE